MAGVSDKENKDVAKQWIDSLKLCCVLDVGAGSGTYSDLCRTGNVEWKALEIFYPYVNMFKLDEKYDEVIIGDIRYIDLRLIQRHQFDLVILADMLEHMSKNHAKQVIDRMIEQAHNVLICFPVEHQEQHAGEEGNDYETHVDHWTAEEMREYLKNYKYQECIGDVLAYFMVNGDIHVH